MLRGSDDGDEISPSEVPSQVRRTTSLDSQPQLDVELISNGTNGGAGESEESLENGHSEKSSWSLLTSWWEKVNPYASSKTHEFELLQTSAADQESERLPWPDESKLSWVSILLFTWLNPVIERGSLRPLQHNDLFRIAQQDEAKGLCDDFENFWETELQAAEAELREPSLPRAIWRRHGRRYLVFSLLMVIWTVAYGFLSPLLVNAMLIFVSSPQVPIYHGFIIGAGLAFSTAIQAVAAHRFYFRSLRLGVNVRSTLVCLLHRKALRTSATVRGKGVGEVLTLMSNDVDKLLDWFWTFPLGVCSVLQYLGCTFLLWYFLGWAGLAGAISFLLLVPLNHFFATRVSSARYAMLKQTDKRVKWTAEVLQGIKMVKLYSYESRFLQYLLGIREEEITHLRKLCYMKELNTAAVFVSPTLLTALTFLVYALNTPLTPAIAFTVLSLFSTLRVSVRFVPQVMSLTAECRVSISRMQRFLALPSVSAQSTPVPQDPTIAVAFNGASYRWEADAPVVLHNLNFSVRKGELLAVVGPVGAGKSTLLQAILSELPFSTGKMSCVSGPLGYVPQQAWIFNGSVRSNILFGLPYNKERYRSVVAACALLPDLALLPGGDEAEIGERGAALSGGQKLRVGLARALYAAPELLLLDDPLSAVDSHVGRHLFKTICDFASNSTRILVTHQLYTLRRVDRVLVLENGRIVALAPLRDLSPDLVRRLGLEEEREPEPSEDRCKERVEKAKEAESGNHQGSAGAASLMEVEERQQGGVAWRVYAEYLKVLGGPWVGVLVASLFIGAQGVSVAADTWLANWSANPTARPLHVWLAVYMGLSVLWGVFLLARALAIVIVGLRASRRMHARLAEQVLRAPLLFFNSTPVGRIINRFSKDTQNLDESTPTTLHQFLLWAATLASALLVIIVVSPPLILGLPPCIYLYLRFQRRFRDSCRELKRLDSISKSPLFQSFTETIAGLEVIRAFRRQGQLRHTLEERMDRNVAPLFSNLILNRWLAVRLELLGAAIMLATTVAVVLQRNTYSAGYLGFMLSSALLVVGSLNAFIRWLTDVEIQMNSVERVLHYTQLQTEAPAEIPETRPPPEWPSAGRIDIEDLHLRYREDLPSVLHGVTCSIGAGEKIGVVGRTGAGKSSLVLALFRLCEPHQGIVRVDGVDISKLGLSDLRSRLSIIPQVRSNLDPFSWAGDDDVWEALRRVRMKDTVTGLEGQLDAKVEENGVNFSVGQRQLMCLARALIKRARVLVLDEATASIDPPTDALIQATIRSEFADCTVIAIAHRLATVLDADKVLVLDRGRVAEFGPPKALLSDPSSRFAGLVAAQNAPI